MDDLRLVQWLSPAFPVSAYAYSHGLEAAMADGAVVDADGLAAWIRGVMAHGAGRNDALLLVAAMRGHEAEALAQTAFALAGSAGRWRETRDQGAAFAATLTAMGRPMPPHPYPVAVGVACRGLDLPPARVAAQFLMAFAGALVSAGQRYLPLGQAAAQAILADLHSLAAEIAAQTAATPDPIDALGGCVFAADIDAAAQEALSPRMFRS